MENNRQLILFKSSCSVGAALTSQVAAVCPCSPALCPSHKGAEGGRSGRRRIERAHEWPAAAQRGGGVAMGGDSV